MSRNEICLGKENKMSMSTFVVGIAPPDENWHRMKAAYDACVKAGAEVPDEIYVYFGKAKDISDVGLRCDPADEGFRIEVPHQEWADDMQMGIEVQVDQIPPSVKTIRFYNSW
jgi:hypothetical protein